MKEHEGDTGSANNNNALSFSWVLCENASYDTLTISVYFCMYVILRYLEKLIEKVMLKSLYSKKSQNKTHVTMWLRGDKKGLSHHYCRILTTLFWKNALELAEHFEIHYFIGSPHQIHEINMLNWSPRHMAPTVVPGTTA